MTTDTEAEAIAKLAVDASAPHVVTHDERAWLVIAEGAAITEVTEPYGLKAKRPKYVHQHVLLQDRDSLILYANRFKTEASLLFADMDTSTIVAVIDYHDESGAGKVDPNFQANHAAHKASMVVPLSEEWKAWKEIDGKLMDQLTFARFIEENTPDIKAPDAGTLMDAVRDMQAHRKVNFTAAVRTQSENVDFEYSEEVQATTRKDKIELPHAFVLCIPVYFGESSTELHAFLRWRLDEGALKIGIQLHRAEHVRQAAFRLIMEAVGSKTGCPVVFGKPNKS